MVGNAFRKFTTAPTGNKAPSSAWPVNILTFLVVGDQGFRDGLADGWKIQKHWFKKN